MSTHVTTRIVLVERPTSTPEEHHFRVESEPVAELADGQARVKPIALSIDAFIRTALNEGSFHRSVPIGGLVSALGVGLVEESRSESIATGDHVFGPLGAQTVAVVPGAALMPIQTNDFPAATFLGALGMSTGVTAYCGMAMIGEPQPGQTVVVSAAAGAVGSIAAQVAKLAGANVIGIAGGPHKQAFLLDDLGLAGAIDYKNEDVAERLSELAPDGVNVFFDNVGNPILDLVLDHIAERSRVVICGAVAQYGNMQNIAGPSLYLRLAERHSRMEGFTVMHFADRWDEATKQLSSWLRNGDLIMRETVVDGIEQFPEAIAMLFNGGHVGKLLLTP